MKVFGKVLERVQKRDNALRAEGMLAASAILRGLADGVVDTDREDMRRGLLAASGVVSVMAAAVQKPGEGELGFIDVDGDAFPVDMTLRVRGVGE